MRTLSTPSTSRLAVIAVMALLAASAIAQTPVPPLDLRLHELPLSPEDESTAGEDVADTGTAVHGSFTTGIGYSKNFGNSTYNAAELDVSRTTDSGRVVDLHIGVQRETGVPYALPPEYVTLYPNR